MKPLAIASAMFLALAPSPGHALEALSEYSWKNRVLLIFGATSDPKVTRQVQRLTQQEGELAERDMVVLQVTGNSVRTVHGPRAEVDGEKLKRDAGIEGEAFQIVLIGKDGGIKLRRAEVVGDVEIFDLIDRMPMRRAEGG